MKKSLRQFYLLLTFKACDSNGIPMEFKFLIHDKDDLKESNENNGNISSSFKCLKAIF